MTGMGQGRVGGERLGEPTPVLRYGGEREDG